MNHMAGKNLQAEIPRGCPDERVGLASLLEQFRPYLLAIAQVETPRQLAGKVAPSDLVQESMLRAWEHFPSFAGASREQLAGWLRKILLNHLRNTVKAYGTEKRELNREQPADSQIAAPREETPSQVIVLRERHEIFQDSLARLPNELGSVIELRHRDDLTFVEIGRIIGKTKFAVRRLWMRAIQQLRQELKNESFVR